MKHDLISDLHKLLFSVPFESVANSPREWDLNKMLGRAFLNHHNVHFKDKEDVPGSEYWSTDDVEAKFYDKLHPGGFVSVTDLENICEDFLELDMWERNRKMNDVLAATERAIYSVVATADYENGLTVATPEKIRA